MHNIKVKAAEIYAKIKQKTQSIHGMDDAILLAFFFAELSQEVRDLNGRAAEGVGLACSRLIKNFSSIPLLVDSLRSHMKAACLSYEKMQ